MLYEYLCSNYKPNEPIFVADVSLPVSNVNLRQMFKILCDSGKIRRFDTGVYYIPKESRLKGGVPLGADTVARYKYISRNGRVDGYYSGYTFANQLGVTTQVPYMVEIVSNNASARVRGRLPDRRGSRRWETPRYRGRSVPAQRNLSRYCRRTRPWQILLFWRNNPAYSAK